MDQAPEMFQVFSPEDLLGLLNDVERRHAPERIYVAGTLDLLREGPRVAVVGSCTTSQAGIRRTERLVKLLVERGVTIVSGLARGIDCAAHLAAIRHGGRTIAVLGTPLDQVYPSENAGLQQRIMADHLAISEFEPRAKTQPWHFPKRNRTMALIADASVIVEAGESSGTLSQGWEALRLNRPLFLLKSIGTAYGLKWPQEMLSYGARLLDEDLEPLFDVLPQRSRVAAFGPEVALVPVPGSAPARPGGLWVALRLCKSLKREGLAGRITPRLAAREGGPEVGRRNDPAGSRGALQVHEPRADPLASQGDHRRR